MPPPLLCEKVHPWTAWKPIIVLLLKNPPPPPVLRKAWGGGGGVDWIFCTWEKPSWEIIWLYWRAAYRHSYAILTYGWRGGGGALLAIAKKRQSTYALLNGRHCKGWQTLSCPLKRKPLLVRLALRLESKLWSKINKKVKNEKYRTVQLLRKKRFHLHTDIVYLNSTEPKLGGLPKQIQNVRGYNVELLEKS